MDPVPKPCTKKIDSNQTSDVIREIILKFKIKLEVGLNKYKYIIQIPNFALHKYGYITIYSENYATKGSN